MMKSWLSADISAEDILFSTIRSMHLPKETFCFKEVIPPSTCRHALGTYFAFEYLIRVGHCAHSFSKWKNADGCSSHRPGCFLGGAGLFKFFGHPTYEIVGIILIVISTVILFVGIRRYRTIKKLIGI